MFFVAIPVPYMIAVDLPYFVNPILSETPGVLLSFTTIVSFSIQFWICVYRNISATFNRHAFIYDDELHESAHTKPATKILSQIVHLACDITFCLLMVLPNFGTSPNAELIHSLINIYGTAIWPTISLIMYSQKVRQMYYTSTLIFYVTIIVLSVNSYGNGHDEHGYSNLERIGGQGGDGYHGRGADGYYGFRGVRGDGYRGRDGSGGYGFGGLGGGGIGGEGGGVRGRREGIGGRSDSGADDGGHIYKRQEMRPAPIAENREYGYSGLGGGNRNFGYGYGELIGQRKATDNIGYDFNGQAVLGGYDYGARGGPNHGSEL
uniref:Aa_trans domain-containing protein n=1 Tax=Heterorhabditis bacteriophora TaxID=37862 RepID=A0A1I7XM97_HETBA